MDVNEEELSIVLRNISSKSQVDSQGLGSEDRVKVRNKHSEA